jgi:HEAT repeat protein
MEPIAWALVRALQDDHDVAGAAESALEKRDPSVCVLIAELLRTAGKDTRMRCLRLLAKSAPPVPALAEHLIPVLSDPDEKAKELAIAVAARMGPSAAAAVPALIGALGHPTWSSLSRAASDALARIGTSALPPLQAKLEDLQQAAGVRYWAATTLDKARWTPPNDRLAVMKAVHANKWSDCPVRGETVVDTLVRELTAAKDAELRYGIVELLGKSGDARAVEPISAALDDADVRLRRVSVQALRSIGGSTVVPALTKALRQSLRHSDTDLPKAIADALTSVGWKPADDELAAAARIARGQYEEARSLGAAAVEPLLDALAGLGTGYSRKSERKTIVTVLGKLNDGRAIDALRKACTSDASEGVRRRAERSLGWMNA